MPERENRDHLSFEKILVYFIYSCSWNTDIIAWDSLSEELLATKSELWKVRRLHERKLLPGSNHKIPSYQPSLVTRSKVLEYSAVIGDIEVVVPLSQDSEQPRHNTIKANLGYTVRIFDNGGATCSFSVEINESSASLEQLHGVLHIVHNVDKGDRPCIKDRHLTDSYIRPLMDKIDDGSLLPKDENARLSLHDLFRTLMVNPPAWAPSIGAKLWSDSAVVPIEDPNQDFQTPLVFTVAQVSENSFKIFRRDAPSDMTKEAASVFCRLTLDNRNLSDGFHNISRDYIETVLPFNKTRNGLTNLCLDKRLFFTIGTRGAIALTPDLDGLPSCFVVPSLLNLCEILRVHWHMSVVVNCCLDGAIRKLSGPPSQSLCIDTRDLLNSLFRWRCMFASFLRDPVPYLFDGGSVMEVADEADRALRLRRLREEAYDKLEMLDRLVEDLLERRRLEELMSMDRSEYSDVQQS